VGVLTGVLSLVREPVRLSLRVWELGLSSAASAARMGLELLDQEHSASTTTPGPVDVQPPAPAEPPPGPPAAEPPPAPPSPDSPAAVPDELIPDHVDEEVVLVAEVAEQGAEDGAGPELRIDEPWDGYDGMTAVEVRDRLSAGTAELAAAVELYESTRKGRRSVLDAAQRALRG